MTVSDAACLRAQRQTAKADLTLGRIRLILPDYEVGRATIGFQPSSISVDPDSTARIIVSDYFHISVRGAWFSCHCLTHQEDIVAWARTPNGRRVRLFPEYPEVADAARLQGAVALPGGDLVVFLNGEREGKVFRLHRSMRWHGEWFLAEEPIVLEKVDGVLQSLAFHRGELFALSSMSFDKPSSTLTSHNLSGKLLDRHNHLVPKITWLYGIGFRNDNKIPYFVVSKRGGGGIFHGPRKVFEYAAGTGICFPGSGYTALIVNARYNVADWGEPGEIICIRARLLDRD